jgi:hypothetical protein
MTTSLRLHVALVAPLIVLNIQRTSAALPILPEQIAVTCFSGTVDYNTGQVTPNLTPNGFVVAIFDTRNSNIGPLIPPTTSPPYLWSPNSTPPFSGFHNETGQLWNAANLGEVFGITVDDAPSPNIYVTATECYNQIGASTPLPSGPGGKGGVYKLNGTTGAITWTTLPNHPTLGPGHGNICFRRAASGQGFLYVSDLENGLIYRLTTNLVNMGTPFDHGVQGRPNESLPQIFDLGTPGITQFGRRIWGLKTFRNRLFYSVWWEDGRNPNAGQTNEIWSVDLDNTGNFLPLTARRRISLPNFTVNNWSFPAASIDFSDTGVMFLAERYWQVWPGFAPNANFGAHHTRILRYTFSGGNWVTTSGTTHHIGGDPNAYFPNTLVGANSGGGVAVNCDESIWATGDMFAGSYSMPPNNIGGPGDLGAVYGTLRIPTGGNSALAGYGYGSFAIDYDGLTNAFTDVDKFAVGSITTVRDCCIPPPANMVAWWPLDEPNGATTFSDLSGNGNTAVVESGGPVGSFGSPQAIVGKVAGAKYFINAASRGRALNAPSLNFGTGSFTIDCWVRPIPNPWQPIVDKLDQITSTGYTFGVSNGNLVLRVGDGAVFTHIGPVTTPNIWNFVGVIVDRASSSVRFHLNGVTGAPQTLAPSGSFNNTIDLLIGATYDTNNVSEVGVDELELFNRALAREELESLWLADRFGKCKTITPCTNSVVSIFCPPDMNVQTCGATTNVVYPNPVASTTCGTITNLVCTPPSGSPFPPGVTQVTCTATDSSGATATCKFNITVKGDTTPPFIDCNCLTNMAHEVLTVMGCYGRVPDLCKFTDCFRDECCVICSQSIAPNTVVGPGSYSITVTISDCARNTNSCVVTFTVIPPPEGCETPCLYCPPDNITVTGCPPLMPDYSTYSFAGTNCAPVGPLTVTQSPAAGTPLPPGNTTAVISACDALGNCITCIVNIKAVPTGGDPVIKCPPNQVLLTCSNSAIGHFKAIASGHNGPVLCSPPSGSSFPLGVSTVTCTATNACGGSATCSFTITVKDAPPRWCWTKLGIGIPYELIGGATAAIAPEDRIKIIGPAICLFPNPASTASGVVFRPGRAKKISFTTELDLTADEGPSLRLTLLPRGGGIEPLPPPLLAFHAKGNGNGYCIKSARGWPTSSDGTGAGGLGTAEAQFRTTAIGTNGDLFASFTHTEEEIQEDFLRIFGLPGVTSARMTVTVDLETLAVDLDFEHCLWTQDSARKGWDGCIYGNSRPPGAHRGARFTLTPLTTIATPIAEITLVANGLPEILVDNPSITEVGRKWGDGHVTLMKAYDDAEGTEFRAFANGGGVHVDLGYSESFDLALQRFSTLGDERLLTRTLGSIEIPGAPPPPFLDAMMLQGTPEGVRCSADFNNIGSPTVHVQVYNQGMLVAERAGVIGRIGQPLLILPDWPMRLAKLGGRTPCRRGNIPPGNIIIPSSDPTVPPEVVFGDEFRVLAELSSDSPHPAYYSGFEFITSEDAHWGVTDVQRTHACPPTRLHISRDLAEATVIWDCPGFVLEGAEDLSGPWHDLAVESPARLPTGWPWRFFRLRDR